MKFVIDKIAENIRKVLKKPHANGAGITFLEFYDTDKLTTYHKKVKNTKFDPTVKDNAEYGKPIRYLTEEEIKEINLSNKPKDLSKPKNMGKIAKSKKTQDYLNRKRRQI